MKHAIITALVVAACGTGQKPVANETKDVAKKPATGFCPFAAFKLGVWTAEVFPACPGPPFPPLVALCGGGVCQAPCASRWSKIGGQVDTADIKSGESRYRYDAQGRWLATVGGYSGVMVCSYDLAGKLARCDDGSEARRDGSGRLVHVSVAGQGERELRYDERGRVIAVGELAIGYDAVGQLVRAGEGTLDWRDGRVVATHDKENGDLTKIAYDLAGRIIEMVLVDDPNEPERKFSVRYDGDRVVEIKSLYGGKDGRVTYYDYACE